MPPRMYNFAQPTRNTQTQRQLQCRVTAVGVVQAAMATVWLAVLSAAFIAAISGMSSVEECLRKSTSPPPPPPPHPPPPDPNPPPPAAAGVCSFVCKLQLGDRRCNPTCNIPACHFDGGDCASVRPSVSSRVPPTAHRPTTLDDLFRIGRSLAALRPVQAHASARSQASYSYDAGESYSYDGDSYASRPPPPPPTARPRLPRRGVLTLCHGCHVADMTRTTRSLR